MPEVANRYSRALARVLLPLLLLGFAAFGAVRWVEDKLQAAEPAARETVTITVPPGSSTRAVADLLVEQKLIKDATVFRFYVRYRKMDAQLKPGEYQLSAAMTVDQIMQKLIRGEVVVYRFTVPEGLTVEQIADVLTERKVVDREAFLKAAARTELVKSYLPEGGELAQPLEGYLFPDTYEYKPGASADEIVAQMFARWQQVFTPELHERAKELGLSVHEVMTLASIIEKEAQVAKERSVIAGVYHNRLEIGMKLDADPTVRYALKKPPKEELLYADLEVESPYNTYRNAGLPPGPIAAPGEASIKAALHPEEHDFWYFVARADGTGEHFFAADLDEQTRNIERARENQKK